jgi:hypothetical protein
MSVAPSTAERGQQRRQQSTGEPRGIAPVTLRLDEAVAFHAE